MSQPTKRKGRPLLAAAAGVAFVSFVSCRDESRPVGNLRAPDPVPTETPTSTGTSTPTPVPDAGTGVLEPVPSAGAPDAGPPLAPVGNLRPPESAPADTGGQPVGNLKPPPPKPPPKPHPVGNLRAP